MKTPTDPNKKIEALKTSLSTKKAALARVNARRKAAYKSQSRAQETRRKIIAGTLLLKMMEEKENVRRDVTMLLDKFLTRAGDRALFNLPALEPIVSTPAAKAGAEYPY